MLASTFVALLTLYGAVKSQCLPKQLPLDSCRWQSTNIECDTNAGDLLCEYWCNDQRCSGHSGVRCEQIDGQRVWTCDCSASVDSILHEAQPNRDICAEPCRTGRECRLRGCGPRCYGRLGCGNVGVV
ncbi:hypothetical protein ASPFODRAFT_41276 [Aspergillus luchuensis CBS 106.47]|uniref:EGF-like domain-containing protein n=1 Tax=Aspergillus luchuensis (strain CBS 106.47) TaxID=1137211 RepID=A0A1M3TVC5_ASPLC|nr:hypothetical protein ASPFODRAFT_41276 [Aspergillus luchuensis CBS 106.47]